MPARKLGRRPARSEAGRLEKGFDRDRKPISIGSRPEKEGISGFLKGEYAPAAYMRIPCSQLAGHAAAHYTAIGLHQERKVFRLANFATVIFGTGIL